MKIRRRSILTGKEHVMDIDVREAQIVAWKKGTLIQDAMPDLSPDEREFIQTGITKEEWEAAFNRAGFDT